MESDTENLRDIYSNVFLSHNWGKNSVKHKRVSLINKKLKEMGYKTWFDEKNMWVCIDEKMAQGIESAEGVIVFLTRPYHEKVNGKNAGDNCKKEFLYASEKKTRAKMVPVVMEKSMLKTNSWSGLIGFHLCGETYIDISGDLEDNLYLTEQVELLKRELQSKGIHPGQGMLYSNFFFQYCDSKNYSSQFTKYFIKNSEMIILPLFSFFLLYFVLKALARK